MEKQQQRPQEIERLTTLLQELWGENKVGALLPSAGRAPASRTKIHPKQKEANFWFNFMLMWLNDCYRNSFIVSFSRCNAFYFQPRCIVLFSSSNSLLSLPGCLLVNLDIGLSLLLCISHCSLLNLFFFYISISYTLPSSISVSYSQVKSSPSEKLQKSFWQVQLQNISSQWNVSAELCK